MLLEQILKMRTSPIEFHGISAPDESIANEGRLYFDKAASQFKVSENNGAYTGVIAAAPIFGDGSDGAVEFDGTTVILGLTPSSSIYTLTRDIYLSGGSSIASGVTIKTAGFRIFCTGALTVDGTIQNNGNVGGDGGDAVADAAGAAGTVASTLSAGSCPAPVASVAGVAGGAGGTGVGPNGTAGVNGTATTASIGAVSGVTPAASGAGGDSGATAGGSAGAAGTDGTVTALAATVTGYRSYPFGFFFTSISNAGSIAIIKGNGTPASPGAAGAGAGDATNKGGGGGGSGANGGNGGYLALAIFDLAGSGVIRTLGGDGGAGGAGGDGVAGNAGGGGGGAGGCGGTGGFLFLITRKLGDWSGTLSVAGGSGGDLGVGGAGQGTGDDGSAGESGVDGADGVLISLAA